MTRFRRNPGLFDDDEDLFAPSSLEMGSDEDEFERELRKVSAEVDKEQSQERRVKAAGAGGGVSAQVLALAEPGLRGALSDAQKLYVQLGERLDSSANTRQARRDFRDARRLLERSDPR